MFCFVSFIFLVYCLVSWTLKTIVLSCIYRVQWVDSFPNSYSPTCSPLGALSLKGSFKCVLQQVICNITTFTPIYIKTNVVVMIYITTKDQLQLGQDWLKTS